MITDRPRRLAGVSYVGYQRYFVTTCTAFRKPIFNNHDLGHEAVSQILQCTIDEDFDLIAYCLMPDHAHLLVAARSEAADFTRYAKLMKQVTGFNYKQATGRHLWQPGFHDRILRDDEATSAVARYIIENPVRAGLAKALGEWPLTGSGVYRWPEIVHVMGRAGVNACTTTATRAGRPEGLHYNSSLKACTTTVAVQAFRPARHGRPALRQ